ncbi:MAG: 3-keto-5-aminohexanoate cleavage protein [Pseudomonadota bacterium]|nr:3-keto-5-aminohexanoate cleavage protein [Pseudomonadota bacterium]
MQDVWLEVALNGSGGKAAQPLAPVTVQAVIDEAMACLGEGASILHYHAYDDAGRHDARNLDFHRAVLEGVRARTQAVIYPTTAMRRLGQPPMPPEERFRIERALVAEGLLDVFVLDPGSCNFSREGEAEAGFVYLNPAEETVAGFALARETGLVPALAIYEPGFARAAQAIAAQTGVAAGHALHRVMFSDRYLWGVPPSAAGVAAMAEAMRLIGVGRWMMAGIDFDMFGPMRAALELGADVRVGLEDAPRGAEAGNAAQVARARAEIAASGRGLAGPEAVRREIDARRAGPASG